MTRHPSAQAIGLGTAPGWTKRLAGAKSWPMKMARKQPTSRCRLDSGHQTMRTLLCILLVCSAKVALATAQMSDEVRFQGQLYELPFEIRTNALLSIYDCRDYRVPRLIPSSTACKRGYVATWEIKDDMLYLMGLRETLDAAGANEVTNRFAELFPRHRAGLPARWFTGMLRLCKPNSERALFGSDGEVIFSHEVHVDVANGKVISCRSIDNSEKVREAIAQSVERIRKEREFWKQRAQEANPGSRSQMIRAETNRVPSADGSRR